MIDAVLLAVLAVFVQVLVPHKFIGWAVMLVYIVATIVLATIGFEHNLYNYGGDSPVPLSDMNGMGRFWIGRAWFQAYWLAFASMLRGAGVHALAARHRDAAAAAPPACRPPPPRPGRRGSRRRSRFRGPASALTSIYNTNILNAYTHRA